MENHLTKIEDERKALTTSLNNLSDIFRSAMESTGNPPLFTDPYTVRKLRQVMNEELDKMAAYIKTLKK